MSSKEDGPPTAYEWRIPEQNQEGGKGLDAHLKPPANFTQIEKWGDDGKPYLEEYKGQGLLKGKAVLITGGDSGIGRSAAVLMAREGADISFVYLPEEEKDAQDTKKMIEDSGSKAHLMALDITSEENTKKAIDGHIKTYGKINVLVNNSAMQEVCKDMREISLESVERTYRTNILSMFALTKYALPHMKRGDCIINSSSVAAYMGNPELVDYSSTKGAISTFTRSLAQQLAPQGIRVNAVAPGIIWTPLQPATLDNPPSAMKNIGVDQAPLRRPGMPVEVGTAYVFLASPLGSYFTGETLHGNGGLEVQG